MAIYILIKRKNGKRYSGVFKAKPGVSASKLRTQLKKDLSKQVTFRLASFKDVKRVILSQKPKSLGTKKKSLRRKVSKSKPKMRVRSTNMRTKSRVRSRSRMKRRRR